MEVQIIQNKIYEVRGQKIMLDFDLAELYEVETRALNQAVKRNIKRFPARFMFRLTVKEWNDMRSQFVIASGTSGQIKRNVRVTPFAFTEHGVTMLASVLRSDKAIEMNIAIVEAFIALREWTTNYKELTEKMKAIEGKYDKQFEDVYDAIDYLLRKEKLAIIEQQDRTQIGFKQTD